MKKIFIGATIIALDEQSEPLKDGALGINDQEIIYVGKKPDEEQLATYDEVITLSGKAILPGFVNTHCHAGMSILRGYGDDLPLQEWLEKKVWPLENRFQSEQVGAGTALSILEMLRSGTTCFLDFYDQMDTVANWVLETGIRGVLCRGVIGFGSEEQQMSKLKDAVRFSTEWQGTGEGRITTMLTPHSPYTCSPKLLTRFIEEANELSVPLHTHMSETAREVAQNVAEYGQRPVKHLQSLGFFDQRSLVAHSVHVTDEEIDIMATHDVKVAHNPRSNLKLGSGIAPIPQMLQKGIRPGLATDGASSNNKLNMLDEIQLTALIHKGHQQDPLAIPAYTALEMGTRFGAESLFLEKEIGSLAVGKKADFIVIDTTGPHMVPSHHLISDIVYAASSEDIRDVYVNGKQLIKNREALTIDEEKVKFAASEAIKKLL